MQHLSTRDVPERQRRAYVHDFVARNWAGMRFDPLHGADLHVDITFFALAGGVALARAQYPPMVARRARDLLGDGRDNYTLAVVSDDHEVSVEGGPAFSVDAGDLMLVNEGTCFEVRHQRSSAVEVLSLDRREIAQRVPQLDLAPCYHIPRATPGAELLAGYANLLRATPPTGAPAGQTTARHIHDLVGVVLDAFAGRPSEGRLDGLRAARLELARRDVRARACDATLDVHAVARRQRVSARYIQELFEQQGTTFTAFLRETRLDLAHRSLAAGDPRSIAAIAFESGFNDLSHFNRNFRLRFGVTPSAVRAAALLGRRAR